MQVTYSVGKVSTQEEFSREESALSAATSTTAFFHMGPLAGFGRMLKKEMSDWYGTRRWLWVGGAATLLIGAMQVAFYIGAQSAAANGDSIPGGFPVQILMQLLGSYLVMAAVLVSMSEIIEEKKSGTAAWIMSKPASHYAFILSKWVAASVNVGVLGVLIPGTVGLALAHVFFGTPVSIADSAPALGILVLYYAMTVAFTIFLGVVTKSQGAVAAIAIGFIVLLPALNIVPGAAAAFLPTSMATVALALVQTGELLSYLPMLSGAIVLVVSLVAAALLFKRQEL
jgi:ABC-2 type transport system permease protein